MVPSASARAARASGWGARQRPRRSPPGRLVVADASSALAVLFGRPPPQHEPAPAHAPADAVRRAGPRRSRAVSSKRRCGAATRRSSGPDALSKTRPGALGRRAPLVDSPLPPLGGEVGRDPVRAAATDRPRGRRARRERVAAGAGRKARARALGDRRRRFPYIPAPAPSAQVCAGPRLLNLERARALTRPAGRPAGRSSAGWPRRATSTSAARMSCLKA